MARISFYIFKENPDGSVTLDRDVDVSQLTALRNGFILPDPDFVNNGDGTIFYEASGSGAYTIRLDGKNQDEYYLTGIADEDAITTSRIDETSIHLDPNHNRLRMSGSVMSQSMVIDNTSTADSDNPLSGLQGRELNYEIGQLSGDNVSILRTTDIVNSFTASSLTDRNIQSAESLKLELSDTNYLTGSTSLLGTVREMDRLLGNIVQASGSIPKKKHLFFGYSGSITAQDSIEKRWLASPGTLPSSRFSFTKTSGSGVHLIDGGTIKAYSVQATVVTSSDDSRFHVEAYIDGTNNDLPSFDVSDVEAGPFGRVVECNISIPSGSEVHARAVLDAFPLFFETRWKDLAVVLELEYS